MFTNIIYRDAALICSATLLQYFSNFMQKNVYFVEIKQLYSTHFRASSDRSFSLSWKYTRCIKTAKRPRLSDITTGTGWIHKV